MGVRLKPFWRVTASVLIVLLGLAFLFPFFWAILTSFKTAQELWRVPPSLLPESWRLNNYVTVITNPRYDIGQGILNSVLLCGIVIPMSLLFCSLAGYGFAKHRFKGKEWLFMAVEAVLFVPIYTIAIPLFKMVQRMGLVDHIVGVALPLMISAFGVVYMRAAMAQVPDEIIEAARIDGCGEGRLFFTIILPLVRPSLLALGIIKFVWTWSEFFWPLVVTMTPTKRVATLCLASFSNMYFVEYHLASAAVVIVAMPVLVIVFGLLRTSVVRVFASTGLKG